MLKRILALTLALSVFGSGSLAQAATFSDIGGSWAQKDILRLADLGILNGDKGKFLPKGLVTRAEFAKMMVTTLGLQDEVQALDELKSPFTDLPVTHWANGYIMLAYEQNILYGYPGNTIRPEAPITRLEATALLTRALGVAEPAVLAALGGKQATGDRPSEKFKDQSLIPDWGREYLDLGVTRGLITGYADFTFKPDSYISRSEAAVLAVRLAGQQGRNIQLQGKISAVSSVDRTITLELSGEKVSLGVASDAVFYKDSAKIGWKELTPGLQVGVILDAGGEVTFLEQDSSGTATATTLSLGVSDKGSAARGSKNGIPLGTGIDFGAGLLEGTTVTSTYEEHPERSLELTKKEMRVDELTYSANLTGDGQTIAIIDTGVDPAHPDLLAAVSGKSKIVQYMDFTQDGLVTTSEKATIIHDAVSINGKTLQAPSGISKSGVLHIGHWKESEIASQYGSGIDLNLDGDTEDEFTVAVVDGAKSGVYDSILVDTNGNLSFRDEILLSTYNTGHQFAKFGLPNSSKRFGFVLAKLKSDGTEINLGFDGNGHGTHVAGTAAGSGQISGVAPGARLMVLKAMDDSGQADWTTISDAINYAASHGAKVVNLSLGQVMPLSTGTNKINKLLQSLMETKGMIFVVAAGNSGPGLTTVSTPGDTEGVISVGAYISPAMWKQDYQWDVEKESLWFFSSTGPRFDGAMMPTLLAPGSVVSTAPGGNYMLSEGTSMAAPHVTGTVALLLEGAAREKIPVTPALIREALALGAKKLDGFTEVEQGYGKLDAMGAWNELRQLDSKPYLRARTFNALLDTGSGLYAREFNPGQLDTVLQNLSTLNLDLQLFSTQPWLKPKQSKLYLPGLTSRTVTLQYQRPEKPGLYTARLQGRVKGKSGLYLDMLTTLINPYVLDKSNGYSQSFTNDIAAGQYQRYFVQVPEGTNDLKVTLNIPQQDSNYQGRARIHLYSPTGTEIDQDLFDFAGVGPDTGKSTSEKKIPMPEAGTWEVVVYSSATLSDYGLKSSQVNLQVQAEGVTEPVSTVSKSNYIVSLNPGAYPAEQPEMVTLHVRAKSTLQPFEGVVSINSKLYSVKNGSLTLITSSDPWPDQWNIALPE